MSAGPAPLGDGRLLLTLGLLCALGGAVTATTFLAGARAALSPRAVGAGAAVAALCGALAVVTSPTVRLLAGAVALAVVLAVATGVSVWVVFWLSEAPV